MPSLAWCAVLKFVTRSGSPLSHSLLAAAALFCLTVSCSHNVRVECDPLAPSVCTADQKCSFYFATDPSPICHNVLGTLSEDMPCHGTLDDFDVGLQCTGNGNVRRPTCRAFCETEADCGTGRQCNIFYSITAIKVCSDPTVSCDPVAQDCAVSGQACYALAEV